MALVEDEDESGCDESPPKASVLRTHGASVLREDPPPPLAPEDRDEEGAPPPPPLAPLLLEAGGGAEGLLRLGLPPPSAPIVRSSFSESDKSGFGRRGGGRREGQI